MKNMKKGSLTIAKSRIILHSTNKAKDPDRVPEKEYLFSNPAKNNNEQPSTSMT